MIYKALCSHIDASVPIYGIQARGIESDLPAHETIAEMAQAYVEAIRIVQPQGPYRLLGWSLGGVVAHEMARQIETSGYEVEVLFALDPRFDRVGRYAPAQTEEDILPYQAEKLGISVLGKTKSVIMAEVLEATIARGILPAAVDLVIMDRMMRAMLEAKRLISEHTQVRVQSPIVYFRASDNDCIDVPAMLAAMTVSTVIDIAVGAKHEDICEAESAAIIGSEINRYLLLPVTCY